MIKHMLFLVSLSLLISCSSQPKNLFIANFENACGYPVEIRAHDHSNGKAPFPAAQPLAAGEAIEVLSYIAFGETLADGLPGTYRLDIAAQRRTLSLDKERLLAQLARSPAERKGNAITTWTISDTSLCP